MLNKTGPKPKPVKDRFMSHVDMVPIAGCWLWTGHASKDGYGRFGIKSTSDVGHRWKVMEAHQMAWELFKGVRPTGNERDNNVIDHICNNRICVNPDHLQVLGRVENVMKGRA